MLAIILVSILISTRTTAYRVREIVSESWVSYDFECNKHKKSYRNSGWSVDHTGQICRCSLAETVSTHHPDVDTHGPQRAFEDPHDFSQPSAETAHGTFIAKNEVLGSSPSRAHGEHVDPQGQYGTNPGLHWVGKDVFGLRILALLIMLTLEQSDGKRIILPSDVLKHELSYVFRA